eukprot:879128-Pelagomonas_calceolata.AAC.1
MQYHGAIVAHAMTAHEEPAQGEQQQCSLSTPPLPNRSQRSGMQARPLQLLQMPWGQRTMGEKRGGGRELNGS